MRVTDGTTRAVWAAVRDDQVLRARVRGALSGLKAEFRGHRDEAMWLLWITRVQQQLVVEPPPATAAEVVSDRADDAWATALDAPAAADDRADAVWDAAVQTSDGRRSATESAEDSKAWAASFEAPTSDRSAAPSGTPSSGVPASGFPSSGVQSSDQQVVEQPTGPPKPRPQVPMVVFQTPSN
ncbi:hypothetical protein ABZ816_02055 [Actinosynnema sp. NPDC047251]|uniref:hypothetical protein n=1 Tax=Saccharothrix espanaensis TaxID=103731 RepID=UPI0011DC739B|nr:hypothetical protein [Saccharothrix espanaensis]